MAVPSLRHVGRGAAIEGVKMEWALLPFKRCWDFDGRSRRKEYWLFLPAVVLMGLLAGTLGRLMHLQKLPTYLLLLVLTIPSISLQMRRFHDRNMSGWFVLMNFIPYIGTFIVMLFMALPGTNGPNDYGTDPRVVVDEELADIFGG